MMSLGDVHVDALQSLCAPHLPTHTHTHTHIHTHRHRPTHTHTHTHTHTRTHTHTHTHTHAHTDTHTPLLRPLHRRYSRDGVEWHVATNNATGWPSLAWSKHVEWTNGSTTYISRMERPQVVLGFDPQTGGWTTPIYLTTAVCPGGLSVGGRGCTDLNGVRHKSWNLYRAINR
jgi:hypothetical protein